LPLCAGGGVAGELTEMQLLHLSHLVHLRLDLHLKTFKQATRKVRDYKTRE